MEIKESKIKCKLCQNFIENKNDIGYKTKLHIICKICNQEIESNKPPSLSKLVLKKLYTKYKSKIYFTLFFTIVPLVLGSMFVRFFVVRTQPDRIRTDDLIRFLDFISVLGLTYILGLFSTIVLIIIVFFTWAISFIILEKLKDGYKVLSKIIDESKEEIESPYKFLEEME